MKSIPNAYLIIPRLNHWCQEITNLGTFIDLLEVEHFGNTTVVNPKREKTPRETLAQLYYSGIFSVYDSSCAGRDFLA
ncbi:MAG: hypothetical protein STSR0006_11400 [Lentimicrobium sp.]